MQKIKQIKQALQESEYRTQLKQIISTLGKFYSSLPSQSKVNVNHEISQVNQMLYNVMRYI